MTQQKHGLPGFAVRRPITMLMLFLSLLVVGTVAWRGIPLQLLPEGFDPPFLYVWMVYPNASPVENMERIAIPVEGSLWTVQGTKKIRTRSRDRGCGILIEFKQSVDMDVAYLSVRDRLERARPELPDDLRYIYIWRYSEADEPILYFSISINGNYNDPYRLITEEVVKKIERVDGVAKVETWGSNAKMIRIEFILDRLKAYNIDIADLMRELRRADFAIAGGNIVEGDRNLLIRADGRIGSLEEIANLPIRRQPTAVDGKTASVAVRDGAPTAGVSTGNNLHLRDIAKVSYSEPRRSWIQRVGRQEAVEIGVYKVSDANTIELSKELNKTLKGIANAPIMAGMHFDFLFDQGDYIAQSLNNLQEAGLWGGLFAVIVLFIFLRRFRMTLFIALAIPLSLLTTVICLYFMGWSLNVITLSGLMICVGLVVDNAIVVVESIHTSRQQGMPHKQAATAGAYDVGLAITLATLTTMVVFLPMMLMSGDRMLAFFLQRVGLPVIFALLASLMAAMLFIPLAVHRFALSGSPKKSVKKLCHSREGGNPGNDPNCKLDSRLRENDKDCISNDKDYVSKESKWIKQGSQLIEKSVRWVLNHRTDTFLLLVLLMASISIPMQKVVSTDQENSNINDLQFGMRFPAYYSLNDIDSTMTWFEDQLYERAVQYDIKTIVTGFRRGFGRIRVFMNDEPDRVWFMQGLRKIVRKLGLIKSETLERKEMVEDLKEWLEPPPDVKMYTSWQSGTGEKDEIYVTVYGEDTEKLLHIAEDVKGRLDLLPKAISVEIDLETAADEVKIQFDRSKTSRFGVDPFQAATGLISLIRGVNLPDVRIDGYEISAVAELREEDRATLAQVMNLPVGGDRGEVIRLDDVASVGYGQGLGQITRENRRTRIRLKITTTEDDLHELSKSIDNCLFGLSLPPGYEWGKGRRFETVEEAAGERSQAWLLAIMFVFLLMGALFESFLLPFCVIVTVPFSFFGVYWFLFMTGTQFGIMAGIGVIILIGVVVNNAIVLVDRVNKLRKQGYDRDEALAVASRQRFRPIVMTALTTIMGLVPMAVGDAALVGIPYSPMGRAIIGGMLSATITTPLVVPLAYSIIDDFKNWLKKYTKLSV
ncbi:MAG: efflux RND transporter permease subunit [Candidatus Hatepunaea meridiana]|nr:efflux RND transporter permease subunit [Candidatus Hatepunaea meridiana]